MWNKHQWELIQWRGRQQWVCVHCQKADRESLEAYAPAPFSNGGCIPSQGNIFDLSGEVVEKSISPIPG